MLCSNCHSPYDPSKYSSINPKIGDAASSNRFGTIKEKRKGTQTSISKEYLGIRCTYLAEKEK